MDLLDKVKNLIFSIENEKPEEENDGKENEVENEKIDKRKLIDEVGGILKGKVDDEIIRTIIGKLEKLSYDGSEDSKVDNEGEEKPEEKEPEKDKKEVEEIKKEVKEDVKNKCDNSKEDYFGELLKIYNSNVSVKEPETGYVSTVSREKAAEDYFKE